MNEATANSIKAFEERIEAMERELRSMKNELDALRNQPPIEELAHRQHDSDNETSDTEAAMLATSHAEPEAQEIVNAPEDATEQEGNTEETSMPTQKEVAQESSSEPPIEPLNPQGPTSIPNSASADLRNEMSALDQAAKALNISTGTSPNERAGEKETLVDKAAKGAVADLKRAIGINERFLYANELFKGDMEAFNRAIEEINHLRSGHDAKRLIDEQLAPKYKWSDESETAGQFRELIGRKFDTVL